MGPGRKTNCLQKATVQSPWTTHVMATARNVGTACWICFIKFAHRVKAHNNICLVYTKFNAVSYGYKLSFFGGPIALHGLVHFLNTTGSSLTKVVYAYFDRISHISYCISIESQLSLVLWIQMLQKVFSWITGSIVFEFHDISQCIYCIYIHIIIHIYRIYISYLIIYLCISTKISCYIPID